MSNVTCVQINRGLSAETGQNIDIHFQTFQIKNKIDPAIVMEIAKISLFKFLEHGRPYVKEPAKKTFKLKFLKFLKRAFMPLSEWYEFQTFNFPKVTVQSTNFA